MPIGIDLSENLKQTVRDLGFEIVDNITLLGMTIDNKLLNLESNFDRVIKKITGLISFWERFKLSLPGRIAIAKTFFVSLLNYLGCFLLPNETVLKTLQTLINNFIRKNLKISDARIERSIELGGTGFFNIKKFLMAQQCTWINRAFKLHIDNWRYDLRNNSPAGNILNIRKGDIDKKITQSYGGL
jgi:hypothetical protein